MEFSNSDAFQFDTFKFYFHFFFNYDKSKIDNVQFFFFFFFRTKFKSKPDLTSRKVAAQTYYRSWEGIELVHPGRVVYDHEVNLILNYALCQN